MIATSRAAPVPIGGAAQGGAPPGLRADGALLEGEGEAAGAVGADVDPPGTAVLDEAPVGVAFALVSAVGVVVPEGDSEGEQAPPSSERQDQRQP